MVQQLLMTLGIEDRRATAQLVGLAEQMDPVVLQTLLNPDFLNAVGEIQKLLQAGTNADNETLVSIIIELCSKTFYMYGNILSFSLFSFKWYLYV